MKIVTVVGARPQFIKAAVVSRELKKYPKIKEIIIHTGQHYDRGMSDIFFSELQIPEPACNLGIVSGYHGEQTGRMLTEIEKLLIVERPDWVLVYGDTNSTLAGALAASKLGIRIAHVEAGLRSYNNSMPEEINRIMTDHISTLLFAPTRNACLILEKEGLGPRSVFSGDVMYDSILFYEETAGTESQDQEKYYLATIHRPYNTDVKENLISIFKAFNSLPHKVILPLHPRTRKAVDGTGIETGNIRIMEPVGYREMVGLLKNCEKVLTDSGGLQKEAYFLKKQCVTIRTETEWTETLHDGWNVITGAESGKIIEAVRLPAPANQGGDHFGDGRAGEKIIQTILGHNINH